MAERLRALYIGRFQPFHRGHLDVVQTIAAATDVTEILLAVGSAQYDHRTRSPEAPWRVNPFSFEERAEMIRIALSGVVGKPWQLFALPDQHNWERWYAELVARLPEFAVLYTNDPDEHAFFRARGKQTRDFPRRFAFHGGSIRRALAAGEDCRDALPPGVVELLERLSARERLRGLEARDEAERQG